MNKDYYERNYSHSHCWNQKPSACGQPIEKHKQCCLCDTLAPTLDKGCEHGGECYKKTATGSSMPFGYCKLNPSTDKVEKKCEHDWSEQNNEKVDKFFYCSKCKARSIAPTPSTSLGWEENYIRDWSELAKTLSECADVMPKDLRSHQIKIYNAALDMAYAVEEKNASLISQQITKAREEEREKIRQMVEKVEVESQELKDSVAMKWVYQAIKTTSKGVKECILQAIKEME